MAVVQRQQRDYEFEYLDKRLELIETRINMTDKRLEEMIRFMDKRFEAVDKRLEEQKEYMDKRFEEQLHYMDKRFEEQLHYMDKRFEDMNKKFGVLQWVMILGFTLMTALMSVYKFVQ